MYGNNVNVNPQVDWSFFTQAKELKNRLLFTLMILFVYRLGTYIPVPGIEPNTIIDLFNSGKDSNILDMFNMLSGGALSRMSLFALNIIPYISASIIMQLLTLSVPYFMNLKKEGVNINYYTRILTIVITVIQAYGIAVGLESFNNGVAVINPGIYFRFVLVTSLVGGTMFLMWLGEQITARGVGNGISLIIFTGIIANLPSALVELFELGRIGSLSVFAVVTIIIMALALVYFVVFIETAQRRINIQYPKRQVGNKAFAGQSSHLPMKLNTAGVIPAIFASSFLLLPTTIVSIVGSDKDWLNTFVAWFSHGQPIYMIIYGLFIAIFAFFYTSIVFNPIDTANNIKKNGGFVPGMRPGSMTADYFDYVLTRLTMIGICYLIFLCILPELLISKFNVPFYLGGTSILIVVTVALDTYAQIQSYLFAGKYEKLIGKSKTL